MERKEIVIKAILLAIATYVFLLSINLLSASFKLFGEDFAASLISLTSNPFVGLFIGILATSIVQSSSTTTSIIVGLTASGALTIGNAIPIIMGANIGTSVTNTIVSLGHIKKMKEFRKAFEVATVDDFFNLCIVVILFPLELLFHPLEKSASFLTHFVLGANSHLQFASPLDYITKPVVDFFQKMLGHNTILILILSLVLLFLSLRYFIRLMKPIAKTKFKRSLNKYVFKRPVRSFAAGLALTGTVQSSSVSTSLLVPLAGVGILTIENAFPYVLGANIGTTGTALIASLVPGSAAAITVALVHVFFNVFGAAIMYPLRKIPISLSKGLASLSMKSKVYVLLYVTLVFFVLPMLIILLFS